jgi:hypothetical protein
MAMHYRLPCSHTDIEPDVIPGRPEILLNHFFALIDQDKHSLFILNCQGKIISHMPERYDEQVPHADWVVIPTGIAEIVLRNDLV